MCVRVCDYRKQEISRKGLVFVQMICRGRLGNFHFFFLQCYCNFASRGQQETTRMARE